MPHDEFHFKDISFCCFTCQHANYAGGLQAAELIDTMPFTRGTAATHSFVITPPMPYTAEASTREAT